MSLKDKAKTYNFWISLVSAIVLIVRIVGDKFNFIVDTSLIMDVTTGLCSIFVILGILSAPKTKEAINAVKDTKEDVNKTIFTEENNSTVLNNEKEENIAECDLMLEGDSENDVVEIKIDNNSQTNKEENILTNENDNKKIINDFSEVIIEHNLTINETENNPKSIEVLIENLKADIHKANMMIQKLTQEVD